MKNLYDVYERMHFYAWQDKEIVALIEGISQYETLQVFEESSYLDGMGPFITTLYLLVSFCFDSRKLAVVAFLRYLLEDEHTRSNPNET